jgi:AraC-like DNA-binding protein
MPRYPNVFGPNLVFVGRGRKRAYFGGEVYEYDPDHYVVFAVPLPYEHEWDASSDEPLLAVSLAVEPTVLGEVLVEMDEPARCNGEAGGGGGALPRGLSSAPVTPEVGDAVARLLECLRSPTDARVLGRQAVREVIYRVLCGERGGALRALAHRDEHFTRIARVLRHLHAQYAKPHGNDELARRAGMSVTAASPVQYVKRIRLHRARLLMAHEGYGAGTAAAAVGYESASQFGREFKRLFGKSPAEDAVALRARFASGPAHGRRSLGRAVRH